MADPLDDELGLGILRQQYPYVIAPPSGTPGVRPQPIGDAPPSLSGQAPPPQPPAIGAPQMPTHPPSPGEAMTQHGQQQLSKYQSEGPGWSQIQNPFLRGLAHVGDIAGTILAPGITPRIPGTTMHNEALQAQARGEEAQGTKEQGEEAQTAHTQAGIPVEQAQVPHIQAETREANAEAALKENPQPKEPNTAFELWRQQNPHGTLQDFNKANAEGKPGPHQNDFEQFYGKWLKDHNFPDTGHNQAMARKEWAAAEQGPQRPPQFLGIVPQEGGGGKAQVIRPGTTVAPGTVSPTQAGAASVKEGQANEAVQGAVGYATDYLNRGVFTGPGDEALQEKFFELAKPSTGFRMTQPQIKQLQESRNWLNSFEGKAYHAIHGTWFSDDQRKQIVDTMNQIAQNKPHQGSGGREIHYKVVGGQLVPQ